MKLLAGKGTEMKTKGKSRPRKARLTVVAANQQGVCYAGFPEQGQVLQPMPELIEDARVSVGE